MLSLSKQEWRRLAVFAVVGTVNTAVCYAVYAVLVDLANWHYTPALVADYVFGALTGFVMHRATTFNDRRHVRQPFRKYSAMLAVTFAINWILLDALVRSNLMGPLWAQADATVVVTLVGYLMQTRWVFRSHVPTDSADTLPFEEPPRRKAA